MVNEQDNDKERYPEERNTGVDVDAEEDGKCATDISASKGRNGA